MPMNPRVPRTPLLLVILPLLLACSPDKGFGESERVQRDDYGSAWPLTVGETVLTCTPEGDLHVTIAGDTVRLDVSGPADAERALRRAWATQPGDPSQRMDLSPLVESARALC